MAEKMDNYVQKLVRAIALFDHSRNLSEGINVQPGTRPSDAQMDEVRLYHEWQLIAARDGAFSIYHFKKVLEYFDNAVKQNPFLGGVSNRTKRKAAIARFNSNFPHWEKIRHAAGHAAELALNVDSNAIQLGDNGFLFKGPSLHEDNFQLTKDGEELSYRVHTETSDKLGRILDSYLSAFE